MMTGSNARKFTTRLLADVALIDARAPKAVEWAADLQRSAFPSSSGGGGVATSDIADPTYAAATRPDLVDLQVKRLFDALAQLQKAVGDTLAAVYDLTPPDHAAAGRLRKQMNATRSQACGLCGDVTPRIITGLCGACYKARGRWNGGRGTTDQDDLDAWRRDRLATLKNGAT